MTKTMFIEDKVTSTDLTLTVGSGSARGFIKVEGKVGKDVIKNMDYRNGDDGLRSLFNTFGGNENGLGVIWCGAVLFDEVHKGNGGKNTPIILEQLIRRIDDVLFAKGNDDWDPDLEDKLVKLLDTKEVSVGNRRDKLVWQMYAPN